MKRPRLSLLLILFFSCILLGTKYYIITWAGNSTNENEIVQQAITWMYTNGLTSKATQDQFKPNETVNREQAAKFFSMFATHIYNKEIGSSDVCTFSDIKSADKTLISDIQQACALEIMKGNNKKFFPKKKITYGEAISTLIRIMYGKMEEPQNAYYTNYYAKAKEIGLVGNIKVKNNIRRGELAIMMYKASLVTNDTTTSPIAETITEESGLANAVVVNQGATVVSTGGTTVISTGGTTGGKTNDITTLPVSNQEIKRTNTNISLTETNRKQYFKTNLEIGKGKPIYGLSINANINLGTDGFVRVVLIGKENNAEKEYLVYEESSVMAEQNTYTINDSCDETCILPEKFIPQKLYVEIQENSSIKINQVNIIDNKNKLLDEVKNNIKAARQQSKANKAAYKLGKVKKMIATSKLSWKAGITPIANMTYQEKKRLFLGGEVPDLGGFEYYIGGAFEKRSKGITTSATPLNIVQNFDWRTAHGKNLITPVKNQGTCNSSRTFSVIGAVEGVVNAYLNKNVSLNLSEQDIISNSNGGNCDSGYPTSALDYIKNYGVVDEQCYAYGEVSSPTYTKCSSPTNLVKIGGKSVVSKTTETDIKKALIDKGPLNLTIRSLNQAVVLVGFETDPIDGTVTWVFKNSWGSSRGEYGYGKIKTSLADLSIYAINMPVTNEGTEWSTTCEDNDLDGYCNWGILATKPSSCAISCKPEKDCDDANARARALDQDYNCGIPPQPICTLDQHLENNVCVNNTQSCTLDNGSGSQLRINNSRSNCTITSCTSGYVLIDSACTKTESCSITQHRENNTCINNTRSCSITNGIGVQTRGGTSRSTCTVVSCNAGYKIRNNECVVNKQTTNRRTQ